jgi:hypothetical protein
MEEREMTGRDNFFLHWARLKRDSEATHKTGLAGSSPPLPVETVLAGAEATSAQSRTDAAGDVPFDLASLPSIETIAADTDIRGFLQSCVPAELTRAALRRAWVNDPAIRDFIGIAENQWDFNDPNAIPGFGPLRATDSAPALLAQALGGRSELAEMIPDTPASMQQPLSGATDRAPADLDHSAKPTIDGSASINRIRNLRHEGSAEVVPINDRFAKRVECPRHHRSFGGALPRWDS